MDDFLEVGGYAKERMWTEMHLDMHLDERCPDLVRLDGEKRTIRLVGGLGAPMVKERHRRGDAVSPLPDVAASLCAFSDH